MDERIVGMGEMELDSLVRKLGGLGWQPAASLLMRIYKLCDGQDGRPDMRSLVMSWIRFFDSPQVRRFILKELRKHKYDWLGDWAIIALVGCYYRPSDFNLLADLFGDPRGIDSTRESAVKGLSNIIDYMGMDGGKVPPRIEARARDIAAKALADPFPETRISGIWLARKLGGFDRQLRDMAENDHAKCYIGTVAEEAASSFGDEI